MRPAVASLVSFKHNLLLLRQTTPYAFSRRAMCTSGGQLIFPYAGAQGPANDKIFDAAAYEKFLIDHIKVEGKTGQLGEDIKISTDVPGQLAVTSSIPFSKRYLKYLTKRFLKKNVSTRGLYDEVRPRLTALFHSLCASGSVSSRPRRTPTPSASSTSPCSSLSLNCLSSFH